MLFDLMFKGKSWKKFFLSVYASMLGLLSSFNPSARMIDMPEAPNDFVPVMRFTIASDVHIRDEGNEAERERLALMIQKSYEIAEADGSYTALDAVCFAGDITDAGTRSSFEVFKQICEDNIRQGTLFLPMLGNHDFKTEGKNTRDVFAEIFEYGPDFHVAVNGVHIIASSKIGDNASRNLKSMHWLREQLDQAKSDNPDNPIFVIQHEHIFNTVYGSYNWGDIGLKNTLSAYSQVIDFSGHSHYPINDPRSIWQGKFTALGTGSLSYFELEVDGESGKFPQNYREAAQMYVVEVAANGATRIRCYDLISDSFFGETYYIEKPSDPSTFAYNEKNRKAKSIAPVFLEGTQITPGLLESGETALTFQQAKDDLIVHNYRIAVKDEKGNYVYEDAFITDYFLVDSSDTCTVNVGRLESGKEYSVSISAENAFGQRSLPITATFTAQ
ncbi:MAG: metallophosphoesterase [Oscillospiraceae bacterium]|nr:metallophosphoesterase [Oscillospiraceae bacterium]